MYVAPAVSSSSTGGGLGGCTRNVTHQCGGMLAQHPYRFQAAVIVSSRLVRDMSRSRRSAESDDSPPRPQSVSVAVTCPRPPIQPRPLPLPAARPLVRRWRPLPFTPSLCSARDGSCLVLVLISAPCEQGQEYGDVAHLLLVVAGLRKGMAG